MFEDELLGAIRFQNEGIFIERPDASGQFDATDKVNGDDPAVFACGVQERVLYVLCSFARVHIAKLSGGDDGSLTRVIHQR